MFKPCRTPTQLTGDILDFMHTVHWATPDEVAGTLGCSREAAWRHLGILVREGLVVRDDKVRPHRYRVAQPRPEFDHP